LKPLPAKPKRSTLEIANLFPKQRRRVSTFNMLFSGLQSLRLRNIEATPSFSSMADPYSGGNGFMGAFKSKPPPHSQHPDFANLTLLVFEAVMEVVCVSLPGYIVARMGGFDAVSQELSYLQSLKLICSCRKRKSSLQTSTHSYLRHV
jgi:hypothetical protein